jgi:hypothetical protein
MIRTIGLRTALLGSAAAFALVASPALASEIDDLDAQIDQLQSHLDQLKKQRSEFGTKPAAAPADAVVGGDFPGSFKLPGSDTSVAIHGYTKLDVLFDVNQQAGDSFDVTSLSPNGSAAERRGEQVQMHARQSRLTFETRTPTNYGQIFTVIQGDFFGQGGAQFASNSSTFRIRQAYGALGPVLAGQTWTNWQDIENDPETLDFQGPAGQVFVRQPQLRYRLELGKFTLSASIENPAQDVVAAPFHIAGTPIPTPPDNPAHAISRMPDITAREVYADTWGHISGSLLGRYFETDNGGGDSGLPAKQNATAFGGGVDVSGTINVGGLVNFAPIVSDQIGFNGFYGSGIGRYVTEGGGFPSTMIKNFGTTAVREVTQPDWGGFAWYLHNWTDTLRSNAVFGIQRNHISNALLPAINSAFADRIITTHVNLIWSPIKSVNIGAEYMWGEIDFRPAAVNPSNSQKSGTDNRIQFSAQYIF